MSSKTTLRLLPWGHHSSHLSSQRLPRILHITRNSSDVCRNASTASSSNPKVLGKPDKFVPPSHPVRLYKDPSVQYPGPSISQKQNEQQKKKHYPNMPPPVGSWLHYIIFSRWIHMTITLVGLSCSFAARIIFLFMYTESD